MPDSILTTPLGGGFSLTRILCGDGGVSISISDPGGDEIFSERIAPQASLPGEPDDPEQVIS